MRFDVGWYISFNMHWEIFLKIHQRMSHIHYNSAYISLDVHTYIISEIIEQIFLITTNEMLFILQENLLQKAAKYINKYHCLFRILEYSNYYVEMKYLGRVVSKDGKCNRNIWIAQSVIQKLFIVIRNQDISWETKNIL